MSYNIKELKNKHQGEDIWIILAGSSLDYIDASFFENKLTIGQNQTYRDFKCDYIIMKDCNEKPRFVNSLAELENIDIPVIYSEYYKGHHNQGKNRVKLENSYYFPHQRRTTHFPDELDNIGKDEIVVSKSTVTSAMHVAAYMGAKNIMLCGHDCGTIDGQKYYAGYIEPNWTSAGNWDGIDKWLSKLENESILVRNFLEQRYNVNIHSLNPFLNMNFESHKFRKS